VPGLVLVRPKQILVGDCRLALRLEVLQRMVPGRVLPARVDARIARGAAASRIVPAGLAKALDALGG